MASVSKMRLHQVAKEFGVKNEELIAYLSNVGYEVHSPMTALTDEMYDEARMRYGWNIELYDKTVFVPDTNFFINNPDFISYFSSARTTVHLDIPLPVLKELDKFQKERHRTRSSHDTQRAWAAYNAGNMIKSVQKGLYDGVECEIIRTNKVDATERSSDVQIVDYAVYIAKEKHSKDKVILITNDMFLPALLINGEIIEHKISNLSLMTAGELKPEIPYFGNPSAKITNVSFKDEGGVAIYVTFQTIDLRGVTLKVSVHFFHDDYVPFKSDNPSYQTIDNKLAIFERVVPSNPNQHIKNFRLFVPYGEFKKDLRRKRQGLQEVKFIITIWEKDQRLAQSRDASYAFKKWFQYI